jgi:NAD(P)-dependent dehydrogenase (short-subunit alcohol dehydrogenase family)
VTGLLQDQTVLVVGRGSGFARAIALTAQDAGARVRIEDLDRDKVRLPFDTKVIGPLMLAKYISPGLVDTGARDALGEQARRTTSP